MTLINIGVGKAVKENVNVPKSVFLARVVDTEKSTHALGDDISVRTES